MQPEEFKQLSIQPNTIDIKQFYGKELERAISFIRRDFELLYSSFYKQMDEYYSIRLEEAQKEIKRLLVLQAEQEIIQTEVEIEQTQKMLTHNNDLYIELQEKYAKFEVELKTVEEENIASYDAYEKDVQVHQEQIEQLAFDIAEILRSKTHLETEIIICRHLLEIEFEGQQPVIVPTDTTSFGSESGKVLTKKTKKGPVGIKECASYGEFITLENTSVSEDVNVSYWILKRRIDSLPELRYTFPSGLIIEHGKELKIYAKNALKQSQETLNRSNKIVNNELASWGYGMNIETRLINANGEERAVHSQTLVLGSQTISS
ncbi:unnamed protein product [Didymodactylos carnosus]|uniref:LTD domain-containing protein n=1 Tax=Didymodactylos carnosus TaxID=1234261 RepID=A0A8S2EGB2_9BILA|nr:unnamed protein product [Didymodactylos carnosus]CAF4008153.1 unnamed protein product [Didymodactylos carnosus]